MEKERGKVVLVFTLVLLISIGLVSAGFFSDWWGTITGKTHDGGASCTDSDGGQNFILKGNVSGINASTNSYYALWDYCSGASIVEYFCVGTDYSFSVFPCSEGCQNGACLSGSGETCSDTDGGLNFDNQGSVTSSSNGTLTDYCIGDAVLEYYCGQFNYTQGWFNTCPDGCFAGACINASLYGCTDSDGSFNLNISGTTNNGSNSHGDYCTSITTAMEGFCVGDVLKIFPYNCEVLGSNYTCAEGSCVTSETNQTGATCTDSDGGIHYDVKGTTISSANGTLTDYCIGDAVLEYYCFDNDETQASFYTCPNGCVNGACNVTGPSPSAGGSNVTCTVDSDCQSGETTTYCNAGGSVCTNQTSYSCINNECVVSIDDKGCAPPCPYGCSGGSCLGAPREGDDEGAECSSDIDCDDESGSPYCKDGFACTDFLDYSCQSGTCVITDAGECTFCSESCSSGVCIGGSSNDCDGCYLRANCFPLGYRRGGEFCTEVGEFLKQGKSGEICENNFECSSNLCIGGECISKGVWQKFLNWFSRTFGR